MRSTAFLLLGLVAIGNVLLKPRHPPPTRKFELMEFLRPFRETTFSFLAMSSFFTYLGGFLPITFLIAAARREGMSEELAGYSVPLFNGAS